MFALKLLNDVKTPWIFYAACACVLAYLLFIIVGGKSRPRREKAASGQDPIDL